MIEDIEPQAIVDVGDKNPPNLVPLPIDADLALVIEQYNALLEIMAGWGLVRTDPQEPI